MSQKLPTVNGVLGSFRPIDYYSFNIEKTEIVTLTLNYGVVDNASNIGFSLINAADTTIASGEAVPSASGSIVETLAAGTYYVGIPAANQIGFPYTLSVTDVVPPVGTGSVNNAGTTLATARQLGTLDTFNQSFADWVGTGDPTDIYTFSLTAAAAVQLTLSGLAETATLTLENASGQAILSSTGNAAANASANAVFSPLAAGTYYIAVTSSPGSAGTGYNLAVATMPFANAAGAAPTTALSMGMLGGKPETFSDYVGPTDPADWYSFTVSATSRVSLVLSGLAEQATLSLWQADGTTPILQSSGNYLLDTSIVDDLPVLSAGTYYVSVAPGVGLPGTDYTLAASATPVADTAGHTQATALAIASLGSTPTTFDGYVGPVNPTDFYAFTLSAGTTVNLRLTGYGTGFAPSIADLTLLDSGGKVVDAAVGSGSYDGLFSTFLPAGTYYAEVTPDGHDQAFYTLDLSAGAPAVGTATGSNPGNNIASALPIGDPGAGGATFAAWVGTTHLDDFYQITLTQTSLVHLDVTGLTSQATLNLDDNSGKKLATANVATTTGGSVVQVLGPGTYYADVNGAVASGGTGFSLFAQALPIVNSAGKTLATAQQIGALSAEQDFSGYVGPVIGDAYYQFTLAADATITLHEGNSYNDTNTNLYLLDTTGKQIGYQPNNASGEAWLSANLAAGTYYVDLKATTGHDYTLAMSATPIADTAGTTFATAASLGTLDAAPCFAAGTRIATLRGAVAVEHLRIGDIVRLADGGTAPIVWLGHRRTDCRRHPRPQDVWPVRVRAGAIAPGLPARDLLLSPDHALFLDGALVPVRYLLNGRTIAQQRRERITYWHVELPRHGVLLAENLPAESYLDTGNRGAFANGGAAMHLHPDFALHIWQTQACAPLVREGAILTSLRQNLLDRAASLGHARTEDPDLYLIAAGQRIMPEGWGSRRSFRLPPRARSVRLISRSAIPAETRADATDRRRLGVALRRIVLDGTPIPLDDARLGAGWHEVECQGTTPDFRWTDGDAILSPGSGRWLELVLAITETYWADETQVAQARHA